MLIGLRNAMMMTGKRLPYDADVEYLESDGHAYIDTGFYADYKTGVRISMLAPPVNGNWKTFFGGRDKSGENHFQMQYQRIYCPNGRASVGSSPNNSSISNTVSISGDTQWNYTVIGNTGTLEVNGATIGTHTSTESWVLYEPLTIFAGRMNGGIAEFALNFKIKHIEILEEALTVRDFIPVRFTNELGVSEGAMFDRANPTVGMNRDGTPRNDGLYRNRGTGAFVIGPDKSAANRGGV